VSLLRDAEGRVRAPYVIGVFIGCVLAMEWVFTILLGWYGYNGYDDLDESARMLLSNGTTLVAAIAATLVTWLVFREPTGLNDRLPQRSFGIGFLFGGAALAISCAVPALVGATSLALTERDCRTVVLMGLAHLVTLGPAGFGEELLLRGIAFQALRRGVGDVAAIILSSLLFGALHLFNQAFTWLVSLEIALVGVWFGIVTVRTGSLWMPMGLHVAWNFFEGFVFGQPVSGTPPGTSILIGKTPAEQSFWSGGAFGPEAAGWTAVVLLVAIGLALAVPRRSAALT
jgi:uncharacterized protein